VAAGFHLVGRIAAHLTQAERLRRRADFDRVHRTGTRVRGRLLTLVVLPNGCSVARLGIAASRKLGGSVRRNRAKRLIREVFRRNKAGGGLDIVVIPKAGLLDAGFAELEAEYRQVLRRISRSQ
jgi:ribonuclease P protein component